MSASKIPDSLSDARFRAYFGRALWDQKWSSKTLTPSQLLKVRKALEEEQDPVVVGVLYNLPYPAIARVANRVLAERHGEEAGVLPPDLRDYLILAAEFECKSQEELGLAGWMKKTFFEVAKQVKKWLAR